MNATAKVIVHTDDPVPLARMLRLDHPDVEFVTCDTYGGMSALVPAFRPDVIYSINFAGKKGFPRDVMLGPGGASWVSVGGSGVDHLGGWDASRTTVTNSAGVAAGMMAEYVIGALLHFTLDVAGLVRDRRSRTWSARQMKPLSGGTMLVVGLGHTGRAVAARAKSLGLRVVGTRAHPRPTENVDDVHSSADLPDLLPGADFVVVCAPLLASTKGLIGQQAFDAMKPGALLVDVSRGGVVRQDALIKALRDGRLGGAALDVFETEPLPQDSQLWELENVLISPHCSGVFDGWDRESARMFSENLQRWKRGETLENIVDPLRGY